MTFVVLKTREIGVMKALGASNYQVMWIFLSQSIMVSIMGVLIGTGLEPARESLIATNFCIKCAT